jgi:hypothetical protein
MMLHRLAMLHRPIAVALVSLALLSSQRVAAQCQLGSFATLDFGTAHAPFPNDYFGRDAAVDGDVLAVAAPFKDVPGFENIGGVYVYRWDGGAFAPEAVLLPAAAEPWSLFGDKLVLDGDVILAGTAATLTEFRWDGLQWNETTTLTLASSATSLDLDGDVLAVGSSSVFAADGKLTIYERLPSGWELEQVLPNPVFTYLTNFGRVVKLRGDTLVATGDGLSAAQVDGAVIVYRRTPGGWVVDDAVTASDTLVGDRFAAAVALTEDALAVSATRSDELDPSTGQVVEDNGSVYIFRRDASSGQWVEEIRLQAELMFEDQHFGSYLDLDGDVLGVASLPAVGNGTVTVFRHDAGSWSQAGGPLLDELIPVIYYPAGFAVSGELLVTSTAHAWIQGVDSAGRANVVDLHPLLDVGDGLAGTGGLTPSLSLGPGLCPGGSFRVTLTDARPASLAWLVVGTAVLGAPFKGGTLVPTPELVDGPLVIGGAGGLAVEYVWPVGFGGLPTVWQAVVQDPEALADFALSNGLTLTSAGL